MFTNADIDQLVEMILAETLPESQAKLKSTPYENLILFHHGYGTWIRNQFLRGDPKAGPAMLALREQGMVSFDDMSMHLIQLAWKKLNP